MFVVVMFNLMINLVAGVSGSLHVEYFVEGREEVKRDEP